MPPKAKKVNQSRSRIAFDGGSSDDSSSDDAPLMSRSTRNQSPRSPVTTPRGRPSVQSPRTPSTSRSMSQTPSRSRLESRIIDSPQPGPSRRRSVDEIASIPSTSRSQSAPTAARGRGRPPGRKQTAPRKNVVLRDIWELQKSTKLLIPKAPFCRVVKEILHSHNNDFRVQSLALNALQEALEMYMVQFLEDAYRCTLHRGQVTLKPSDMVLVRTLRKTVL